MLKVVLVSAVLISLGITSASAVYAKTTGETRPGWGFGDKNHEHVGPLGQSVNVSDRPAPGNRFGNYK